ncbi:hypothetical protein [Bdellovibrio reynosensis]|uniref:Uncharacterized protein n=1 Tax=Bdellovibrio reynosensis TaxID=2835041 RepID=A0ABY4C704_9BACT|nr:hypothetical protein [Bdellovibrio reynosensis]UOF00732.1 hypothetical protein MNR06_13600 [Bdellovibrio reynosensis]
MFKFLFLFSIISLKSFALELPLPVGHREAFIANTGVAMPESPGNTLINPAGLAFRASDKTSLTVSGNAIARQEFTIPGVAVEPEEIAVRPLIAAGIYPADRGSKAIFISSPLTYQVVAASNSEAAGVLTKSIVRTEKTDLVAGVSYARPWEGNENVALGISAGVSTVSEKTHGYTTSSQAGVSAGTRFIQADAKTNSVFVVAGVMAKVTDRWNVGGSLGFSPFKISSKGTAMASLLTSDDPTNIQEETIDFDPQTKGEISARMGQELRLGENNFLNVDVAYQSKTESENYAGSYETAAAWTYAVGFRMDASENIKPMLGFAKNTSEHSDTDLITLGVALPERNNEFIIGAFQLNNRPHDEAEGSLATYGIIFSSNVEY